MATTDRGSALPRRSLALLVDVSAPSREPFRTEWLEGSLFANAGASIARHYSRRAAIDALVHTFGAATRQSVKRALNTLHNGDLSIAPQVDCAHFVGRTSHALVIAVGGTRRFVSFNFSRT